MKRILRILGVILMFFGTVGTLSMLSMSIPMLRDLEGSLLINIIVVLLLLAIQVGVFLLGLFLYGKGEAPGKNRIGKQPGGGKTANAPVPAANPAKPVVRSQAAAPPPSTSSRAAASSSTPAAPQKTELQTLPLPREPELVLFSDESAKQAVAEQMQSLAPQRLRIFLRQGLPYASLETVQLAELFSGSLYREELRELPIPGKLARSFETKPLIAWIEKQFPELQQSNWKRELDRPGLYRQFQALRQAAALHLPDCVYPVPNPFSFLDEVGPDGLEDRSDIACWLYRKEELPAAELIRQLNHIGQKGKLILLLDDPHTADGLTEEQKALCLARDIYLAVLSGEDTFTDLIRMTAYTIKTLEWPCSADDAATYGEWWLEEHSLK